MDGRATCFPSAGSDEERRRYDVSRLMAGSLGTLAIILEASLKALPLPMAETTLELELPEDKAIEALNKWGGRPLPISASAWTGAGPGAPLGRECRGGRRAGKKSEAKSSTPRKRALLDGIREQTDPFFRTTRRCGASRLRRLRRRSSSPASRSSSGAERCAGFARRRRSHRPRSGEARGRPRYAVSRRRQVGRRVSTSIAGAHEDPSRAQARVRPARNFQPRSHVSRLLMQTALADFIRDTPDGREADAILRKCVHCGFCTATCPTYLLLGTKTTAPAGASTS